MKVNKIYRSLLDKSINSMLSAIEIYNKPNFSYREETFAILSVNSWELLLKAILLKNSKYKMRSIHKLTFKKNKLGKDSKIKIPELNRAGNARTISIIDVIKNLDNTNFKLDSTLQKSIFSLIELRDNSIHFFNANVISKELQELGFACIKNYINFIKSNDIDIELDNYNFYLMPLAYVDSKLDVKAILTEEASKYMDFVKNQVASTVEGAEYDIAISIDISFEKSNSFEGFTMKYDENGIPITITEENIRRNFPLEYNDVTSKAKKRYTNFKMTKDFHKVMNVIKSNPKLYYKRIFNPNSTAEIPPGKPFYSTNIWQELDKHYQKK